MGTVVGPWMRDTGNNLDVDAGAGKADYNESLSVLNAGERTLQTVTGSTIPNVVTNNLKGWAYGTSTSGQQAILINSTADISQLSATLNWNVTQSTAGSTIDTSNSGRIFADLALDYALSLFPAAAMPSARRQASSD